MILRAALVAILMAGAAVGPAAAAPELLVDADTGAVLHASEADVSWRPASLTKLMTVHLALSAIESGRLSMSTPVRISKAAAAQPPSKSGFRAGSTITLGDAIKVLLVKSANDLAVAVAETVGGNVPAFVASMNAEAARLKLTGTNFRNPNGLDDPFQVTTARDVAVLALVIQRVHRAYAPLFAMPTVTVGGRTFKNTNNLMGKYPGIDGMKTGYVCASGFNIAASATVRGRRMLAVVFGAGSTAKRSERVVRLLDAGFGGARPAGTLDDYRRKQAVTAIDVSQSVCGRGGQKAETVAAVDTVPSGLVTALGVTSDMPQDLAAALLAIGGSAPEPGTPYAIAPAKAAAVPRPAATLTKPADPAPAASVDELFAARADSLPPVPALSEVTVPPVASAPKPKVRPVAAAPAKRRF